jgi:hypothetical protein
MSSPADQWDTRAAEVGPGLKARRVFAPDWDVAGMVELCLRDGLYPVASIKPGRWANVLAGEFDARIDALANQLHNLLISYDRPRMALVAHHEPGDGEAGTLAEWARMAVYVKNRVATTTRRIKVGVIDNGFHFDPAAGGFTDAKLDSYYTDDVLAGIDFLAADCYQGGTFARPGMLRFADRRGRDASTKVEGLHRADGCR